MQTIGKPLEVPGEIYIRGVDYVLTDWGIVGIE